jgi:Fe2+ transport system protein FeoA
MLCLTDLAPGQHGRVTHIGLAPAEKQRLQELGLTIGAEVAVVRVAPLGDPIELKLRGYLLSLRKADAANIQIDDSEPTL